MRPSIFRFTKENTLDIMDSMAFEPRRETQETPPRRPMRTRRRYYRVDRREIAFLRFVLEACDGIAAMTTLDPGLGTVEIRVPPGCDDEVDRVLRGLTGEIMMEPVDRPGGVDPETNHG